MKRKERREDSSLDIQWTVLRNNVINRTMSLAARAVESPELHAPSVLGVAPPVKNKVSVGCFGQGPCTISSQNTGCHAMGRV